MSEDQHAVAKSRKNGKVQSYGQCSRGSTHILYFKKYMNSFITTAGKVRAGLSAKNNLLDQTSYFNRIPTCNGETDETS